MSGDERHHVRRTRQVKRPAVPDGPLRALKDSLFDVYLRAGTPTLDDMAEVVASLADELDLPGAPKRDTIGRILGRGTVPPSRHDTVAVAMVLAHLSGEPPQQAAEQMSRLWHAAQSQPDCPPAEAAFLTKLRERAAAAHGWLEVIHIGRRISAPLAALYVERPMVDESGAEVSLDTLLAQGERVVLLGDPGAGKSTLAHQLALTIASTAGGPDRAPIMLTLRDHAAEIHDPQTTMIQLITSAMRRTYDLEPPADGITPQIADGRCVLLIDGLDELTPLAVRMRFVSQLERFAQRYPKAPILITCRSADYHQTALNRDTVTCIRLRGFTGPQIAEYATRWLTFEDNQPATPDDVSALVTTAATFQELHGNPLLLALMCALYRKGQFVAGNRVDLIELFITLFFSRWDEVRGLGPGTGQELSTRLRAALAHLAWTTVYEHPDPPAMSRRHAVALIAGHLAFSYGPEAAQDEAKALLQFCAGRSWLLTEVGSDGLDPAYGFTHRTFLEFLAAEHLIHRHPDPIQLVDAVAQSIDAQGATGVAHLAVAMADRVIPYGGDAILRLLALSLDVRDDLSSWSVDRAVAFAIRCLPSVRVQPTTLHWICRRAVARAATCLPYIRFTEQDADGDATAETWDDLLQQIADQTPPEQADILAGVIAANAVALAHRTDVTADANTGPRPDARAWTSQPYPDALVAGLALGDLLSPAPVLRLVAEKVRQAALPEKTAGFVRLVTRPGPDEVAGFGAGWLYCAGDLGRGRCPPYAIRLLQQLCTSTGEQPDLAATLEQLAGPLQRSRRPWIRFTDIEGLSVNRVIDYYDDLWAPHFTTELLLSLPARARDAAMMLALPVFGGYRWPAQLAFFNLDYRSPVMTDAARAGLASLQLSPPVTRLVEDNITRTDSVAIWD